MSKLYYGDSEVLKWYEEEDQIMKAYYGDTLMFGDKGEEPTPPTPSFNYCYDITNDISTYTARTFDEVYDRTSNKWYMLNNLNQYEQYGVYGDSKTTYYDGKLVVIDGYEWEYANGAWNNLGETSSSEQTLTIERYDYESLVGITFPTNFKISKSEASSSRFSLSLTSDTEDYVEIGYRGTYTINGISQTVTNDSEYYFFTSNESDFVVKDISNSARGTYDIIYDSIAYPKYYNEKDVPPYMLTFDTISEANSYTGCVYVSEYANINGTVYILLNDEWQETVPTTENYLQFTARNSSATIGMSGSATPNVSISFDGTNWATWDYSNLTIPNGSTLYMKGNNTSGFNTSSSSYKKFTMSGTVAANGNIMSLLYDDNFEGQLTIPHDYCFYYLFYGCTSLTTAPELPATTLANNCYNYMFYGCTSLTSAPTLPATTLTSSCYNAMFFGCGLTSAPQLPATTLATNCYSSMFANCTSLTSAPQLPATTLANFCYQSIFEGCTSLTSAPQLPATTLTQSCYSRMFFGCTSLTTAPTLPAKTLVNVCYNYMFYDCSSLNYIKAMFTTTPGTSYTSEWVNGVASSGTYVKNSSASYTTRGVNAIPNNWTVQTASS